MLFSLRSDNLTSLMKTSSILFHSLVLLLAVFCRFSNADLPGEFPNERIVQFKVTNDQGKTSTQAFPNLVIANLPDLHTRIIYRKDGLTPKGMKGFVIIRPGISGAIDDVFGFERLAPMANEIRKQGYGVALLQPPIYYGDTPAEREKWVGHYSSLKNTLQWYEQTNKFFLDRVPKNLKVHTIERCFFASIALQAIHECSKKRGSESIERLESLLLIGPDSHTDIDTWHQAELDYFGKEENRKKGDMQIIMAAPKVYRDMSFQTEFVTSGETRGMKFPQIFITTGSRDQFFTGEPSKLLVTPADFFQAHKGLPITLFWHAGAHSPSQEIKQHGVVLYKNMELIRPMLDRAFNGGNGGKPGQLNLVYVPDAEAVLSPVKADDLESCQAILARIGETLPPKKAVSVSPSSRSRPRHHEYMFE